MSIAKSDGELVVHWLPNFPEASKLSMLTACRRTFADVSSGVLWVKEVATSEPELATCEKCRESEQWERVQRRGSPGPWKIESNCIISADDALIAIVSGGTGSKDAALLSSAPTMLEAIKAYVAGDVVAAEKGFAEIVSLLG